MRRPVPVPTPAEVERFWSKVDHSGGPTACWPWKAGKFSNGYGAFQVDGAAYGAHRVAYVLAFGPIADGKAVCHHCDNPPCCNAAHFFTGTDLDNIHDRDAKGRTARGDRAGLRVHPERRAQGDRNGSRLHPECLRRGDDHPRRKLSSGQVAEIRSRRAAGESSRSLASTFGVTQSYVWRIITGQTWRTP